MIGRAARRAIVPSDGHERRRHRREEIQLLFARAWPDSSEPMRRATWPAEPPPQRLDAENVGGRVDEDVVHPHPSQTRMCEFPASGSSWKSLAHVSVLMDDPDYRQRVTLKNRIEPAPQEPASAIPPRQPFLPDPPDLIGVPA